MIYASIRVKSECDLGCLKFEKINTETDNFWMLESTKSFPVRESNSSAVEWCLGILDELDMKGALADTKELILHLSVARPEEDVHSFSSFFSIKEDDLMKLANYKCGIEFAVS